MVENYLAAQVKAGNMNLKMHNRASQPTGRNT